MPRLFVGSYLDSEGVRRLEQLALENQHLSERWNTRARWVSENKLHLTWLFLGDVDEELVGDVAQALEVSIQSFMKERGNFGAAVSPPHLDYERFELWPTPRKARLGVIVPSTVSPEIPALAGSITKQLSKFLTEEQRQANNRPFKPHLTIMRLGSHNLKVVSRRRSRSSASIDDLRVPQSVFPIHQSIARIELIESDMGKKVQGYRTIAAFEVA